MGILDRFRELFLEDQAPQPKEKEVWLDPKGAPTQVNQMEKSDRKSITAILAAALQTEQEQTREARYTDFDAMDKDHIAAMLDNFVNTALTFEDVRAKQGFKVECDDQRADEILQAALERTEMQTKIFDWGRVTLKYGDAFVEPLYEGQDLMRCQSYPTRDMYRNQNDKGQLPTGKDAEGFDAAFQQKRGGKIVTGWKPWEIIHFRLKPSDRLAYSQKGVLDDIRSIWKKIEAMEQGMVVARLTRAYPRRIHLIDVTGEKLEQQSKTIRDYIFRMTGRLFGQKPVDQTTQLPVPDVTQDLYVPTGSIRTPEGQIITRRDDVKTEDPAMAGLAEITDIKYFEQKLWSFAPSDVVGIKRNTSGDLDSQDLAYARSLRQFQNQMEIGIRAILKQQLLAYGIVDVEFRVVFPAVIVGAAWKHADARFKNSLMVRNLLEMSAVSRRFVLNYMFGMSDLEIDREFERVLEEQQSPIFAPILPYRNGQPGGLGPSPDNPDTPQNKVGNATAKAGGDSLPTAPSGPAAAGRGQAQLAQLDPEKAKAVTGSGVWRGAANSKRIRGNMGG